MDEERKSKISRRAFSGGLIGAIALSRSIVLRAAEPRTHPSFLLLPADPFSGLNLLRRRYEAGRRPSEDAAGLALCWQLTKKPEFAQRAEEKLRAWTAPTKAKASRSWSEYVSMAMAFDWLYESPNFDASVKDAMANAFLQNAEGLMSRPDLAPADEASYQNFVLRYLTSAVFSLAAAASHPKTAARAKQLGQESEAAFQNVLETSQLVTPDGSYHESMDYFRITLAPMALLAELHRTMAGADPARRYTVFRSLADTYLYKLLPDGTPSREGDNEYPILDDRDTALLGYAVHRFKNQFGAWLLRESGFTPKKWVLPVLEFLWDDPEVQPSDPGMSTAEELPRQRYFAGVGHLAMRTGWKADATWIEFDCGPYFAKHQHMDQNQFTIYHKGYLAIDSGADYTDTESPHYLNYYRRTVAHNSILVYDPREKFFWSDNLWEAANDGGQRMDSSSFWNTIRSPRDWHWTSGLWKIGQMRNVDYQAGKYHYACGDATRAYSAKKLRRFTRELFYLPGQNVLLVFDCVESTNPEFRKVWLLHGVNEPQLENEGKAAGNGGTEYGGAGEFSFAEGEGELRVECLLPEKHSVTKRGGAGNEFWTPGNEKGGDWGSGQNWPLEPAEGGPLPEDPRLREMWKTFWGQDFDHLLPSNRKNVVSGAWRVEVSPAEAANEDFFLHVLHIGDKGASKRAKSKLLRGQNVAGAAVDGGFVVLFSTLAGELEQAEVNLPEVPPSEMFMTGLKPNALHSLAFAGPNIMAPGSKIGPGVEVRTDYARANEKGILTARLPGQPSLRLRVERV